MVGEEGESFQLTSGRGDQYSGLFDAGVAQLVEHHLAKVDVESSSLFARSISLRPLVVTPGAFLYLSVKEADR